MVVPLPAALGHYRLQRKIGAGGMGEVYLAHDDHLGREVAIKLLPPQTFADDDARKRFRKEATALSRINHPNVATIFDFDSDGDTDYLVMEYISGRSLDEMVRAPIPEKEILRIGAQLAEGLQGAHQQGVLHRDLKCRNVRVTDDGRAKILDFGLAKLRSDGGELDVTESVTASQELKGTLPYMPPEQLRGRAPDARSDIYSLGVILFEMSTRRLPFKNEAPVPLVDAILHQPCPPPGRLNPDISSHLEEIILKCLEKEPENRYQTVKELLVDLHRAAKPAEPLNAVKHRHRWLKTVIGTIGFIGALVGILFALNVGGFRARLFSTRTPKIESIAVLPLANLSGDATQEYFVDGMTDELITQLSKIGSLKVISRTSVMRFKNSNTPLPEIAKQLHVDAIVEGSVMRSGDRVRINAQLLTADDRHIWADTFDRDMRDVLALSSEATRAIADQVRVQLTPKEREQLAQSGTVNREAYEAYLQGQYFEQRGDYKKAAHYLDIAAQKDPSFVPAWYELTEAYGMIGFQEATPTVSPEVAAAVDRVLQLAPESAEAYIVRGDRDFYGNWDWAACERDFHHAVELAPRNVQALAHYGLCLSALRQYEHALKMLDRAREVDPLSPAVYRDFGFVFEAAGQMDRALAYYQHVIELEGASSYLLGVVGRLYDELGQEDQSRQAYLRSMRLDPDPPSDSADLEKLLIREGPSAYRRRLVQLALGKLKEKARTQYVSPYTFAAIYTQLGDKELAFENLNDAFRQHIPNMAWVPTAARWAPLRSDPRFTDLLRRMNYPQQPSE